MLLKFAFKDFLDDRKFKNTTQKYIRNYLTLLGEFVNYCTDHEVVNVEDIASLESREEKNQFQ